MMDHHYGDVSVQLQDHIALIEIHRPPHNYFDAQLISYLPPMHSRRWTKNTSAARWYSLPKGNPCAGADFHATAAKADDEVAATTSRLYNNAVRFLLVQSRSWPRFKARRLEEALGSL
jgi:enoyl-CoA hydratase/carnithine racemase